MYCSDKARVKTRVYRVTSFKCICAKPCCK